MPITIREFKSAAELNRVVCRYYPQVRYITLLKRSAVWFSNLEELREDALEGTLPAKLHEKRLACDLESRKQFAHVVPIEQFDTMTARDLASGRMLSAVNCWYMDNMESLEMWNKYGRHGVMVQSTVEHIAHAFNRMSPTDDLPQVGPVRYIDFADDDTVELHKSYDAFVRAYLKDKKWAHEKELRIAHVNLRQNPKGFLYPCFLPNLIQAVVLAPTASENWIRLVQSELTKRGLAVPLLRSIFS